jgi:hypothetical protein
MAALDTRSDRQWWGISNLAIAGLCIPLCYGLPTKDFLSFKFVLAGTGVAAGLNSVRLFSNHSENAGVRSAWRASQELVSARWIEEMAIANLPPSFQVPVRQQQFAGVEDSPTLPLSQFQLAAPPDKEDLPDCGDGRRNYGKMPGLNWYPSVLIYGIPGAGKTTFVEEEVKKRLSAGHRVIVLDPHAAFGQWEGCEVIGAGMDYAALDAKMIWFEQENKRRYQTRQTEPNPKFKPLTILAEEFTNWATRCKFSSEHFKTVNSDIRKVECYSIIVTHTRTLAGLGDAKGMASLRDEAMLEVEILGDYNPETERATPRFEALVKMPGQALSDRTLVKIERKSEHSLPVPSLALGTPRHASQVESEKSGTPDGTRAEQFSHLLAEVLTETALPVFSQDFPLEQEGKVQLAKSVIAQNLGGEKTILLLWGVRRGGRNHQLYVEAKAMLDRLIAENK